MFQVKIGSANSTSSGNITNVGFGDVPATTTMRSSVFFEPNSGGNKSKAGSSSSSRMLPVLRLLGVLQIVADGT